MGFPAYLAGRLFGAVATILAGSLAIFLVIQAAPGDPALAVLQESASRLGVIFITHDLDVARFLSDQVLVMYFGQVVECGPPDILATAPLHPYTRALVEADTAATSGGTGMTGSTGCRFHDRCPIRMSRCAIDTPALEPQGGTHAVACWAVNPEPA